MFVGGRPRQRLVPESARAGYGRISAGIVERDVRFEEPGAAVDDDVDRAYHAKYDRYGPSIVGTVVSAEAARSTLRLLPS